jgi:hypothetical protein
LKTRSKWFAGSGEKNQRFFLKTQGYLNLIHHAYYQPRPIWQGYRGQSKFEELHLNWALAGEIIGAKAGQQQKSRVWNWVLTMQHCIGRCRYGNCCWLV